jgi:hypothetical protein
LTQIQLSNLECIIERNPCDKIHLFVYSVYSRSKILNIQLVISYLLFMSYFPKFYLKVS